MPALVVLNEDAVPSIIIGSRASPILSARFWPTSLKMGQKSKASPYPIRLRTGPERGNWLFSKIGSGAAALAQ